MKKNKEQVLDIKKEMAGRLEKWKKKLIDLTLRNSLLNFKYNPKATRGSKTIKIILDDLGKLEDLLESGNKFELSSKQEIQKELESGKREKIPLEEDTQQEMTQGQPESIERVDLSPKKEMQIELGEENKADNSSDDYQDNKEDNEEDEDEEEDGKYDIDWSTTAKLSLEEKELILDLQSKEYSAKLLKLDKENKLHASETGDHRLFLSIGHLNYFDEKRDKSLKAPLILIPVLLSRENIKSKFYLEKYNSDSKFNISLLEFLKNNYDIKIPELEDVLPKDQHGLDIKKIFKIFSEEIKKIKDSRWFVEEKDCYLSLFSFKKILMYKDIENLDISEMSPCLQYLNDPSQIEIKENIISSFNDSNVESRKLDDLVHPKDLFCPVSYDSSQLQAIVSASRGGSFILQGPPGTGKSQTITNIISQLLATGKKVLFVAEKLVALNVVKKRLEESEIDQFCLELHSNKSKKSEIAKKLIDNHERAQKIKSIPDLEKKCSKLKKVRTGLNEYIQCLHKKQLCGFTVFDAFGSCIKLKKLKDLQFNFKSYESFNSEQLEEIKNIIDEIKRQIEALDYKIFDCPLDGINIDYMPESQQDIKQKIDSILKILESLIPQFDSFLAEFSFQSEELITHTDFRYFLKTLNHLNNKPQNYDVFFHQEFKKIKKSFGEGLDHKKRIDNAIKKLSLEYRSDLRMDDILNVEQEFDIASQKNILIRFFSQLSILKKATSLTKFNEKIRIKNIKKDIDLLKKIINFKEKIEKLYAPVKGQNLLWNGLDTKWDNLPIFLKWSHEFQSLLDGFSNVYFHECAKDLMMNRQNKTSNLKTLTEDISNNYSNVINKLQDYKRQGIDFDLKDFIDNKEWAIYLKNLCEKRKQGLGMLREWLDYSKSRSKFLKYKVFDSFIDFLQDENSDLQNIQTVFDYNFKKRWLHLFYKNTDIMREYYGVTLNNAIKEIRQLDSEILHLSKDRIKSQILNFTDDENGFAGFDTLDRQSKKKKGHMTIRHLCGTVPETIQTLSPCLLMSPLSIAQYLPPGEMHFDYVIFDEASQIPPWDAIGAMARAEKAIIVGDSKQLPPTSFFQSLANEDDDENEDYAALESILEECETLRFPKLWLKYHYRSQHESLIAFSNMKYYKNGLITFPENQITENNSAIIYKKIPKGTYDTSTNTSMAEAEAIVNQVAQWIQDDDFKDSIGIVTFNSDQQKLIEELMENKRREDPKLDKHFSKAETEEPIIIKNLENIQGDERDIIIFSIGFGTPSNQNLSMNFGALNKSGGEKRLNVAITRSKKNMYVYTGIEHSDIDTNRTSAIGMSHLKHFLEYAQKGPQALLSPILGSVGGYDSPFEQAVAEALNDFGWKTEPQIGVGKFRIDIGVLDPNGNNFLAGVECDGATYHSSATARDRDCLRQQILEGLGWNILRIWSTDWWANKEKEIKKIDADLRKLITDNAA